MTLVSILTLTAAVVSVTITWRNNTWRLISQFSEGARSEASRFLNERLINILEVAPNQSRINLELLQDGLITLDALTPLAGYWVDVLRIHDNLSYLSLSFEENGQMLWVSLNDQGATTIGHLVFDPVTERHDLFEYEPGGFPDNPIRVTLDRKEGDPRSRDWYQRAKSIGKANWSDVYVFLGTEDSPDVPGVTYSTPFYSDDGAFLGVLTADIELYSLCQYLEDSREEAHRKNPDRALNTAFAFVVERNSRHEDHVIAYHDVSKILHQTQEAPETWDLIPSHEITEPGLRGFLEVVLTERKSFTALEPIYLSYEYQGIDYSGVIQTLEGKDMPRWLIGAAVQDREILTPIYNSLRTTFAWGFGSFLVAALVSIFLARRVSRPLQSLATEAQTIGRGELEPAPTSRYRIHEIDSLFRAKEEMKRGLRSFQKYVPRELVRDLLTSGQEAKLGGKRACLTVAFSDIVNFTSMAELMEPEEVVEMLSRFHHIMYDSIVKHHGTIDKYIGDAVMAFWGAPTEQPDHPYLACRSALEAQNLLAEQRTVSRAVGPHVRCRIGINTGDLVVGNMGISNRLSYTVIGDSVNLASRLEGLNRHYGTDILISEETYRQVSDRLVGRRLDRVFVKGKNQGVFLYELVGVRGEIEESQTIFIHRYEEAFQLYLDRSWSDSIRILEEMQKYRPNDPSILQLLSRCWQFMEDAPEEDWDGSTRVG